MVEECPKDEEHKDLEAGSGGIEETEVEDMKEASSDCYTPSYAIDVHEIEAECRFFWLVLISTLIHTQSLPTLSPVRTFR